MGAAGAPSLARTLPQTAEYAQTRRMRRASFMNEPNAFAVALRGSASVGVCRTRVRTRVQLGRALIARLCGNRLDVARRRCRGRTELAATAGIANEAADRHAAATRSFRS